MVILEENPTFLLAYVGKESCDDAVQYSLISYNPITQFCTNESCPILSFSYLHPKEKEVALQTVLDQEEGTDHTWLCKQYGLYAVWNSRSQKVEVCMNQLAVVKAYREFLEASYVVEAIQ